MPQQRHLLFKRVLGGRHTIHPVRARSRAAAKVGLVNMVATDNVLRHREWLRPRQQVIDRSLVAHLKPLLDLFSRRAKGGPSQQVRHQRNILF